VCECVRVTHTHTAAVGLAASVANAQYVLTMSCVKFTDANHSIMLRLLLFS
jgi:hypothetical protein